MCFSLNSDTMLMLQEQEYLDKAVRNKQVII